MFVACGIVQKEHDVDIPREAHGAAVGFHDALRINRVLKLWPAATVPMSVSV